MDSAYCISKNFSTQLRLNGTLDDSFSVKLMFCNNTMDGCLDLSN